MPEPMAPTGVPDELVRAAVAAAFPYLGAAAPDVVKAERHVRAALAAVLPLYGKQLRTDIAAGLDAKSDEWRPGRDFAGSVSEFHEFHGKASAYRDAARIVEKGREDA